MKIRNLGIAFVAMISILTGVRTAPAANILWVSIAPPLGFSGPGSNYTDQAFVALLQSAGHNVNRFHAPESQNTLLTPAELAAMNTNDLIIVGRANGSGAWQAPQGPQWNTNITAPLICMSPYLVRALATGNRMGWFSGATLPDDMPPTVWAPDAADAATDYIMGGIPMLGTNSVGAYNTLLDRNTSHITDPPVPGGRRLVSATFQTEGNATVTNTAGVIVDFPAGTLVGTLNAPADPLAGYRMFIAMGSREGATFPNAIALYTGRKNLTPAGDSMFLRAVEVALNRGAPPASNPSEPVAVIIQPTNAAALQGRSVSFSVSVRGAAPRTLQWQRDTGDGVTFTNIPDASTSFSVTTYTIPAVENADNGARFRVVASNPVNTVNSDAATLTVIPDNRPPALLGAGSVDGLTITACFDEPLLNDDVLADPFNYSIDSGTGPTVATATLQPDGKSIVVAFGGVPMPALGSTFTLTVNGVSDLYGNSLPPAGGTGVTVAGANRGLTSVAVGALNPIGGAVACDLARFDVFGGGLDIQGATEQFQFVHQTKDGDFDARVRVNSISGSTRLESVAKALLSARATADGASPGVNVFVTTPIPGDQSYYATARLTSGGLTVSNVAAVAYSRGAFPATFPAWLRIQREGDLFRTFSSANGTDWTEIGSVTVALGPTALIGVGASSHRNSHLATANFSDFQVSSAVNQPTLLNPVYSAGSFSASVATQNGVAYRVEYKDAIDAMLWTPLTTLNGDGMVQTFTDPGPVSPTGNRFYQIVIP